MREDHDEAHLADIRRLPAHIGPRDEKHELPVLETRVVRHEVLDPSTRMPSVADAQHRPEGWGLQGCWRVRFGLCSRRGRASSVDELRCTAAAARRVGGERQERVQRGDGAHGGNPLRVALVEARKDGARHVVRGGVALRLGVNQIVEQRLNAIRRVRREALLPAAQFEALRHVHIVGRFDSIAFRGNLHVTQRLRAQVRALLIQVVLEVSLDLLHTRDRLVVLRAEAGRWKNLEIDFGFLPQKRFLLEQNRWST